MVENRTGAGGTIGMDAAMKSAPDGYTVLITNDNAASAPHIMNLSYDYTKELLPVCYLGRQSQFLAVHCSLGVSTVKELVEYVKKNPGLGYASSGVGSNQHVAGEWFAKEAGIKMEHVPYRGAGQAINDLIAAHVKIAFLGPTALLPHYKAGTIKLLAHTGSKRSPILPEVPTLEESGYKVVLDAWYAAFVPSGTPAGIVAKLNAEMNKALKDPKLLRNLQRRRRRADRRHAGGDRQDRPGRFGEIRAAGERAQHQDQLADRFVSFCRGLQRPGGRAADLSRSAGVLRGRRRSGRLRLNIKAFGTI